MGNTYYGKQPSFLVAYAKKKYSRPLCFTANEDGASISLVAIDSSGTKCDIWCHLQYSTDNKTTWNTYSGQIIYLDSCSDKKVYFRADPDNPNTDGMACIDPDKGYVTKYHRFVFEKSVAASGNIQYLLTSDGKRTDVPDQCYYRLFTGCTSLTQAPELPATTLASNCYSMMFDSCTSLTQAPELPATTLANYCYFCMFQYCTALTQTPILPAITISSMCYTGMFISCSALTVINNIFSNLSSDNFLSLNMFRFCSNIKSILAPDIKGIGKTQFKDCPKIKNADFSNTMTCEYVLKHAAEWPLPNGCIVKCKDGVVIIGQGEDESSDEEMLIMNKNALKFTAQEPNSSIKLSNVAGKYMVSVNGKKTKQYKPGSVINLSKTGDYAQFSAIDKNNTCHSDKMYGQKFEMTGKIAASGNIQSLLDSNCKRTDVPEFCYFYMFNSCTSLTQAPELPATTLADSCYANMFYDCTSLTQAPGLPATTLANYCYSNMFQGCTALTQAPQLPATTLATGCYSYMFSGTNVIPELPQVQSLTPGCFAGFYAGTKITTPPALPWMTLANSCYSYMFAGCTSLTSAPELPATTLADYCYSSMFNSCTSLTQAPELPATTLADSCYTNMFYDCTSLTQAPELPATTLANYCYFYMFSSCTALTQAPKLPATILANSCYSYMFNICTSLTQAPELPATTLANYCYFYMFNSCTSLTQAPQLPATTLANYCYFYMFNSCTSLTQAPELPATTLADSCYANMFYDCTSLTQAPELPATTLSWTCYDNMFYNCTQFSDCHMKANMYGVYDQNMHGCFDYDWMAGYDKKTVIYDLQ